MTLRLNDVYDYLRGRPVANLEANMAAVLARGMPIAVTCAGGAAHREADRLARGLHCWLEISYAGDNEIVFRPAAKDVHAHTFRDSA